MVKIRILSISFDLFTNLVLLFFNYYEFAFENVINPQKLVQNQESTKILSR